MSGDTGAPAGIFGTDGVRDRVGEGLLAEESVRWIARALAEVLRDRAAHADVLPADRGDTVFIARDTRASGEWLLDLFCQELLPAGFDVGDLGVLPTPGAAFCAGHRQECLLAVVLSASHNPAGYNGVKLIGPAGTKAPDAFEAAVSQAYHRLRERRESMPGGGAAGAKKRDLAAWAVEHYSRFLVDRVWRPERLRGRKVFLDLANGAAHEVAPRVFHALGMKAECIGAAPDGENINQACGALEPQTLAARMAGSSAAVGFCFDGDADRMIPVAASGRIFSGDHVLALAGRRYLRLGKLPAKTVVATVMSNLGLEKALQRDGIRLLRTPVGDRHVYSVLEREGHPIGGEQSGHLIFMEDSRTGDGVLAALRLLDVLESDDLDLETEAAIVKSYPQILRNVEVRERVPLEQIAAVQQATREAEARLGGEGRIVLRYSGTEPLARVMLEGPEESLIEELCSKICDAVEENLGKGVTG